MLLSNLLTGMFIGAAMSIPFGPIGVLCIQRIIQRGRGAGLASGLGVALGDSVFASLAILGVTQVTAVLLRYQHHLELVGGLFIAIYGLHQYRRPAEGLAVQESTRLSYLKDISSMFLITVANPQTIIGFSAALVGMVRFYTLNTTQDALMLLCGVFAGSMLWWLGFSGAIARLRSRMTPDFLQKLHGYAAILLAVLGAGLILHAVFSIV